MVKICGKRPPARTPSLLPPDSPLYSIASCLAALKSIYLPVRDSLHSFTGTRLGSLTEEQPGDVKRPVHSGTQRTDV